MRHYGHLLARAEAIVAEPVAGGDDPEQDLATRFVGADDAHMAGFEAVDAIEWCFRQPQALTSFQRL